MFPAESLGKRLTNFRPLFVVCFSSGTFLAIGLLFLSSLEIISLSLSRKLIGRIDLDGDTYLSHNELVSWLVKMEEGYEERDRNEQFRKADLDRDGSVTFEEMLKGFGLGGQYASCVLLVPDHFGGGRGVCNIVSSLSFSSGETRVGNKHICTIVVWSGLISRHSLEVDSLSFMHSC